MTQTPGFGDVIRTGSQLSSTQLTKREFGKSPIKISGDPTRYHTGDVVNQPYTSGDISAIEAMGLAWSGSVNGEVPSG
jgi:hypothetical protein|tara:strand:+ start:1248 stop:1481 length:234 start_codon:yes stop_codon:yes gene_type:complete